MKKKIIIFDLDGVLIDSKKNMQVALAATSKKLNVHIDFNKYIKFLGLPFEKILAKIKIKNNLKLIKKTYEKESIKNIRNIKINKKNLKELTKLKKSFILTVFTSKSRKRTQLILKPYSLFDHIVTSDDVKFGKPHPEGIKIILKKFNIDKNDCIMIGDSYFDFLASKNAKIKYLHAFWGYDKEMNNLKKINTINNFSEIKEFI